MATDSKKKRTKFRELKTIAARLPSPCRICGEREIAAHAEARLRERRPGGTPGRYLATRSLGMCEPCAVQWFEGAVKLMHGWKPEDDISLDGQPREET